MGFEGLWCGHFVDCVGLVELRYYEHADLYVLCSTENHLQHLDCCHLLGDALDSHVIVVER
jgi:hypothetical protein